MKLTSFKSYSQIIFPSQGIFSLISIHILGLIYQEPRFYSGWSNGSLGFLNRSIENIFKAETLYDKGFLIRMDAIIKIFENCSPAEKYTG